MGSLYSLLERRRPGEILAITAVLTLALGVVDYATGWRLSFSVFYLLPVALAAWFGGLRAGLAIAVASALSWRGANMLAGEPYSGVFLPVWNTAVRLGFFVTLALVLARLRGALRALEDALRRERELSRSDALTGVGNARALYEAIELELARGARYAHPLTIAYLDVDGFKSINDERGHSAGDRVLRDIAQTLLTRTRAVDTVARLGGDEFGVLLPETGPEAGRAAIAKLQHALDDAMAAAGWSVSFSIGAVTCVERFDGMNQLLGRADELMYRVKREGKNGIRHEVLQMRIGSDPR